MMIELGVPGRLTCRMSFTRRKRSQKKYEGFCGCSNAPVFYENRLTLTLRHSL